VADAALELDRIGDHEQAAQLAHFIEFMWNGWYDDRQRPAAPRKPFVAPENSREVDEAMDAFVHPLRAYTSRIPDHAAMMRAHDAYVDSLVRTDHIWNK
jgi:hypothetical protein